MPAITYKDLYELAMQECAKLVDLNKRLINELEDSQKEVKDLIEELRDVYSHQREDERY